MCIRDRPSTASASISKPANAAGAYANDATSIRLAKIGNAVLDLRLTGRSTKDYVYKESDSLLLVLISIFFLKYSDCFQMRTVCFQTFTMVEFVKILESLTFTTIRSYKI